MFEKLNIESEKKTPELLEVYHIFERSQYGGHCEKINDNIIRFFGFFKSKDSADMYEVLLKELGCEVKREGNELVVEQEFSDVEIEEANLKYYNR